MSTALTDSLPVPGNSLLAALPPAEWERACRHAKAVDMAPGDVLNLPDANSGVIYFPATAVVSTACVTADGRADALTLVGCDGFVCVESFLGTGSALCLAIVESRGWGYQVPTGWLREECAKSQSLCDQLFRYSQAYIAQIAQTIVCNRFHSVDQQLCRWLLMFLDNQASTNLEMTQERLATLMGVRREGVTAAAGRLQGAGVLQYRRGRISVLERRGLERLACECYRDCARETGRLLKKSLRLPVASKNARHRSPGMGHGLLPPQKYSCPPGARKKAASILADRRGQ